MGKRHRQGMTFLRSHVGQGLDVMHPILMVRIHHVNFGNRETSLNAAFGTRASYESQMARVLSGTVGYRSVVIGRVRKDRLAFLHL
jgi:hypothetical protein